MKIFIKFLISLTVIILQGCGTPLTINIHAAAHLNPDDQNRSLPVELIVYQLQDDQIFRQATFQELWENDQTTLGSSLLNRHEVNVPPNSQSKLHFARQQEVSYIGVIAIFRNPQAGGWRAIKKLGRGVPLTAKHLQLYLQGNHLRFK